MPDGTYPCGMHLSTVRQCILLTDPSKALTHTAKVMSSMP